MSFFHKPPFKIIFASVVLISLFSPLCAFAQDWNQGLNQFQTQTGLANQDLTTTIGRIVQIVLGFLGLIAVIIIIIGGFIWMTSGGAPDKIDKAKALIKAGVIGMIIIILSFAAATFVMSLLKRVGGGGGDINGQSCDTPGICSGCYRCGSDNTWHFDNTCTTCNSNSDTFIVNTIQPAPEDVITIRNSVVRIYLNHPVNSATISSNTIIVEQLIDDSQKVKQSIEDSYTVVNGDLSLDDVSTIKFVPSSDCPAPNQDRKCFDANGTFKVTVSSQLQSTFNNLFLNCSNQKCFRHFKTNDIVDTQAPSVNIINISPSQGIYVPRSSNILVTAQANDDSGISKVSFSFDQETVPRFVATSPDSGTIDHYSFTLDATNLDLNSAHTIKANAFDLDNNQAGAEKNIIIRPAHCFNNTKDEDETGIDCGGNDCQTCLTGSDTCGNGQIEPNEQCDGANLNNKTCHLVDPKYLEDQGALACTANCTFDVSGCVEAGTVGGAGDICKISGNTACSTGASTCQNTQGLTTYSCRQANNDCRCCCNPLSPTNTCPSGLTCTGDKSPCSGLNRGLCCGCKDDSQCGGTNVCDTADSCCHNLPTPFNLTFVSQPTQIQISWNYDKDSFKYVTTFQIERAEKKNGVCDVYLKIVEDKNCNQENPQSDYSCSYIDHGNFAGKQWCYRVRAKHGTNTVYSDYGEGATENISSIVGCTNNSSCTGAAACCRLDTKQCVTWDLCQGQCSAGGACQAPLILYADADFEVTGAGAGIGACLISVTNIQIGGQNFNQNRGYWLDSIKAVGKKFGATQTSSNLVFSAKGGPASGWESPISGWSDNLINAQIPAGSEFDDNLVVVKKVGLPDSNPVSFTVLKNEVGPGQQCYDNNSCPLQSGTCSNPSGSAVFTCQNNATDCYCCCRVPAEGETDQCKNINTRLECRAQSPCVRNDNKLGLCCGCQNDGHCGGNMGCGMKEQNIKCCHAKPIWENTVFCDGSNVAPLNTSVSLNFSAKMDFDTLNNDNIKISYNGPCQSTDEGETIKGKGRCYISGTITNYDANLKTISVFAPKTCRLKVDAEYQVEIVVGENGGGIISEEGVAIGISSAGSCSWIQTQNKLCQSFTFKTSVDANKLCDINSIDVQPRSETVRDIGVSVNYSAYARDSVGRALCVNDLDWSSSNNNVAIVAPSLLDPKIAIATSNGKGEAKIIATISSVHKTCEITDTCGTLKVDLGGPRVVENSDCSNCGTGGQSPSPWKSSSDACANALVVSRFDRPMDDTTLSSNNIQLFACQGTLENPECSATNLSPASILVDPDKKRFSFKPEALIDNTIYKIALKSGDNGIKDFDGYQLDGNRNGLSDGTPTDDYIWYFKTKPTSAQGTDACSLNKVCLNPHETQITPPDTQEFNGEVMATNCNYLDANQFSWTWEKVKIDPWEPDSIFTLSSTGPQASITANPVGLGEAYIKGTAQNKSDQAHLIVATQPSVIGHIPETSTACLNQIISADFDQLMDESSINNNTFRVDYYCGAGGGQPRQLLYFDKIKNIFVNLWKLLFPKAKAAIQRPIDIGRPRPPIQNWCPVEGSIRIDISEGKTNISFVPTDILGVGKIYQVTINNILSRYGVPVNYQWSFNVTDDAQICRLSKIEVTTNPSQWVVEKKLGQYLITKVGDYRFFAHAKTATGEEIYSVPDYGWNWVWSTNNSNIIGNINPTQGQADVNVTINNKNGPADLIATAQPADLDDGSISGVANLEVFLCENPWSYSSDEDLTHKDQTHYELKYCRDTSTSDLLPKLIVNQAGNLGSDMLQNLIFRAEKNDIPTDDVVGLQVYANPDHLAPIDWYNKFVGNPGSPSSVLVDGYAAAQEGRTVYVGAVNKNNNKLNTNIYLLSYNDGASSEILKIYNQLIANWKFNINMNFSAKPKTSLQRDLSRLYDINDMAKSLETYKNDNGFYPKLESGSYVTGLSTSRWPSWQQTLGQELGKSLPVDPLNQFRAGLCADCPAGTQCSGTCYNPDQKKYECTAGSNIYQYQLKENGQRARIYANLEYSNFEYNSENSWDHSCGSYDTGSVCGTHRWCYWSGAVCQSKAIYYYSKESCETPSSCACFDAVYSLKIDSSLPEDPLNDPLSCTDINYTGQTYNAISIGDQCWLKQNLNVGTMITGSNNQGASCDSIQKYCYGDAENTCASDGGLYQWNQAMCGSVMPGAQGICPVGWHIPTHDEWTDLERAVCTSETCMIDFPYDISTSGGRGTDEGTKLKSGGSSGFGVILTGVHSSNFNSRGAKTYIWSSVQNGSNAWNRNFYLSRSTVYRWNDDNKTNGFSVRCIKN